MHKNVLLLEGAPEGDKTLTLLRGNTGILLTFSSSVRHRLEAAGANGMASLKRAHIILGC